MIRAVEADVEECVWAGLTLFAAIEVQGALIVPIAVNFEVRFLENPSYWKHSPGTSSGWAGQQMVRKPATCNTFKNLACATLENSQIQVSFPYGGVGALRLQHADVPASDSRVTWMDG